MSTHLINFVFEDNSNYLNFLSCPDINQSGIKRFAPSPAAVTMLHRTQLAQEHSMNNKPRPYVLATGVNHHPNDWTGSTYALNNTRQSALSYLTTKQLNDVRDGKSMILFDQCLEGYHVPWLWKYFHEDCERFDINPKAIIHVTGNSLCAKQYAQWADENNIVDRMTAIPYVHFEADMYNQSVRTNLDISVDKHLEYKKTNKIYNFNCLQKRLRNHRIWFYIRLFEESLLENSLVSMNPFNTGNVFMENQHMPKDRADRANAILPLLVHGKSNVEFDDGFYIRRQHDQVCLDSWFTVISEASFADTDQQLFLSEKVFKPIICFHPFIILGNKGSLKELRSMGYKTFDGFIDESYDDLSTFDRYEAILKEIKRINAIEDKLSWFESMRPILEHNYETLKKNSTSINPAFNAMVETYKRYFKLGKYKDVR